MQQPQQDDIPLIEGSVEAVTVERGDLALSLGLALFV